MPGMWEEVTLRYFYFKTVQKVHLFMHCHIKSYDRTGEGLAMDHNFIDKFGAPNKLEHFWMEGSVFNMLKFLVYQTLLKVSWLVTGIILWIENLHDTCFQWAKNVFHFHLLQVTQVSATSLLPD